DSAFYPEGFVALRNLFVARGDFVDENPELVSASLEAHQTVIRELGEMSPQELTDLHPEATWTAMPREAYAEESLANDLLYSYRDWVWPTAELVEILLAESDAMTEMGVLDAPLGIEQIQGAFIETAEINESVYQSLGSYPDASVFTDG